MEIFSTRLRELRVEKRYSQKELAKEIDFSQTAIFFWEKNIKSPNAEALIKLAKFFNVSVDYLLGLTD